ncbi:hypothetical protein AWI31_16800 [Enterobacter hormaechei subsp. xiangfangensis]|nr:hypothetical protein AWI31_16800 [Enterobacter hormaechei subsp. xiangfangensis]
MILESEGFRLTTDIADIQRCDARLDGGFQVCNFIASHPGDFPDFWIFTGFADDIPVPGRAGNTAVLLQQGEERRT